MSFVGGVIRTVAQKAGFRIETFGNRSMVLVEIRRPADAWFSYESPLRICAGSFQARRASDTPGSGEGLSTRCRAALCGAGSCGSPHSVEVDTQGFEALSQGRLCENKALMLGQS